MKQIIASVQEDEIIQFKCKMVFKKVDTVTILTAAKLVFLRLGDSVSPYQQNFSKFSRKISSTSLVTGWTVTQGSVNR